jgi:hypothetical protein
MISKKKKKKKTRSLKNQLAPEIVIKRSMLKSKECKVCQKNFIPPNYQMEMCSPHCQRIRRNQRNKANYELRKVGKEKSIGLCASCKKPFIKTLFN